MEKTFEGTVAFVTGGSVGIGRATALAFANRGARVAIADVQDGSETVERVREAGSEALYVPCDVADEASVKKAVEHTVKTFGRLDAAFNNAGVEGHSAPTHECTVDNWDRTLAVNLRGIWLCMKYELPHMLRQGKGAIVNCASIAGLVGFPGLPAYVASKHGVVGLSKTAALEYAKQGIRVNVVCPGVIKTSMIDRFTGKDKAVEQGFADMEPVGRLGQPGEVAEAVVWLCSDRASFVTGDALAVDGGWIAQ